MYLVYQLGEGVQVTLARDLNIPHGQVVLERGKLLHEQQTNIPIHVIRPILGERKSCSDSEFIRSFAIPNELLLISWQDVYDNIMMNCTGGMKKQAESHISSPKRQKYYVDLGFCGGEGYSIDDIDLGLASPSFLSGSQSQFIRDLIGTLSEACMNLCPTLWASMEEARLNKFARQLHPKCRFEFVRLAYTSYNSGGEQNTCNVHIDSKNGTNSEVVIFSKSMKGFTDDEHGRLSFIMCQRKACENYMVRSETTVGPSIQAVMEKYRAISVDRKTIPGLIKSINWKSSNGMIETRAYKLLPCHMEASVFSTSVINNLVSLYI
jgi:hypothetical protein